MSKVYKLYSFVDYDRGARIRWLMREMGVDYEEHRLEYKNKEHRQEAYLKLNPLAQIPIMTYGDTVYRESGGIMTHLMETHPESGLAPKPGREQRAEFLRWFFLGLTDLDQWTLALVFIPDHEENNQQITAMRRRLKPMLGLLENHLDQRETLLDSGFSAADIVISHLLWHLRRADELKDYAGLHRYINRLAKRPAAQAVNALPII